MVLSSSVKPDAYSSLVRVKIEYGSLIRDSYHAKLTTIFEALQNRTARFILHDYSYSSSVTLLKSSLDLTKINMRRKLNDLCFFNSVVRMSQIPDARRTSASLDHSHKVHISRCASKKCAESFFTKTARDCNDVPKHLVIIGNHHHHIINVRPYVTICRCVFRFCFTCFPVNYSINFPRTNRKFPCVVRLVVLRYINKYEIVYS